MSFISDLFFYSGRKGIQISIVGVNKIIQTKVSLSMM